MSVPGVGQLRLYIHEEDRERNELFSFGMERENILFPIEPEKTK